MVRPPFEVRLFEPGDLLSASACANLLGRAEYAISKRVAGASFQEYYGQAASSNAQFMLTRPLDPNAPLPTNADMLAVVRSLKTVVGQIVNMREVTIWAYNRQYSQSFQSAVALMSLTKHHHNGIGLGLLNETINHLPSSGVSQVLNDTEGQLGGTIQYSPGDAGVRISTDTSATS